MPRPEKAAFVEALARVFKEARSVVLNDFTGLDVDKMTELRRLCRENGVEFKVVKNTLAKLSVKEIPAKELEKFFDGPTALAISRESENMPAKVLARFADEHEAPRLKAAYVDGQVFDGLQVIELAKLPTREELLSKVLAGIKTPGEGLVLLLQGPLRKLLYALHAIIEEKGREDRQQ